MKNKGKFFRLAALCALMLCFLPLNAQVSSGRYDNKYYMSAWGALGYANLLHGDFYVDGKISPVPVGGMRGVPHTIAAGGVGGLIGVGFEYNYRRFILTFGAEFDYKLSVTKAKPFTMKIGEIVVRENDGTYTPWTDPNVPHPGGLKPIVINGMVDTEGDPYVGDFRFDNYKDMYHVTYVNFPLLMGAQFANRFYFLTGAKAGLYFGRESYVNTSYETQGIYGQFIDPFKNMPDHFFDIYKSPADRSAPNRNLLDFGLNVVASLEMGKVIVPKKGKAHYRIAAFADYGVLNIHKNVIHGNAIVIPPTASDPAIGFHVDELQHNSILTSEWSRNKSVNPFLVGVKFTVLLDLGNKEPCVCIPKYKSGWQGQNNSRARSITTTKRK